MRNSWGESRTQYVQQLQGSFGRDFPGLGGRRSSAEPIPLGHEPAGTLLGGILDANLDWRAEREALRDWVRRARAHRATHLDD